MKNAQNNSKNGFLPMNVAAHFDKIPQIMKDTPRWLCWQLVPAEPKPKKVPMTPASSRANAILINAAVNDTKNWLSFDRALSFFTRGKCTGIGFALSDMQPKICCVDVDHCFNSDRSLTDEAKNIIAACHNSWTELSQSGEGIHIWFIDDDFHKGRKKGNVEVYANDRYIAVTGNSLPDSNPSLLYINGTCQRVITSFIDKDSDIFSIPAQIPAQISADTNRLSEDDRKIVSFFRSCQSRDINAFYLFNNHLQEYFAKKNRDIDFSVADCALMEKILYYSANDDFNETKRRAIAIFNQSELAKRDKWANRDDYKERTFDAAYKFWVKEGKKTSEPFATLGNHLKQQVLEWQQLNGKINPDMLQDLLKAADDFNSKPLTVDSANNISTQKFLGFFKFYSFFNSVADSFIFKLKKAKSEAKKAVSAFRKNNLLQEPSIDIQMLADFEFDFFLKNVKMFEKQARRNHNLSLEKAKSDEINAQIAADKKRRANDSTRSLIFDCPVDLDIPFDCFFDDSGISILDNTGKLPKKIKAANTPIVPVKILRDFKNGETKYQIAVKSSGTWHFLFITGQELFDPKRILFLAGFGALIESPHSLVKFFARIIAQNNITQIRFFSQPGWKDDSFSFFAYPGNHDDYIVDRAGFLYESSFATKGDKDIWSSYFLQACDAGGNLVRAYIGFALAALLVKPLNIPNLQVQVFGRSGLGKTGMEKLTASIYGDPRKLISTFAATVKNRIAQAAAYNDLPSFFDELETAPQRKYGGDTLSEMIYQYAEGKGNQAQKRDGTAREAFEFYGSRLMTAERSILRSHDKRGAFKRLVILPCDYLLFDDDFATRLHQVAENNFGLFGRMWAEFISEHIPDFRAIFNGFNDIYRVKKQNVEPSLLRAVTVAFIAFYQFKICAGFVDSFDEEACANDIIATIKQLPSAEDLDESTRALDDLRSYIAGHEKFFMRETKTPTIDGDNEMSQSAFECFGKIYKNGEVAIFPTALKKILEDELNFTSCDEIVAEWAFKDLLRRSRKSNSFSSWINGKAANTIRFKPNVLFSVDDDFDYAQIP